MRWPSRRASVIAQPAEPEVSATVAQPDTDPVGGWATQPSLEPLVRPMAPTMQLQDHESLLTSWRSPALSGTLDRGTSADAPMGLVHGMAELVRPPVPRAGPGRQLSPAPKRRWGRFLRRAVHQGRDVVRGRHGVDLDTPLPDALSPATTPADGAGVGMTDGPGPVSGAGSRHTTFPVAAKARMSVHRAAPPASALVLAPRPAQLDRVVLVVPEVDGGGAEGDEIGPGPNEPAPDHAASDDWDLGDPSPSEAAPDHWALADSALADQAAPAPADRPSSATAGDAGGPDDTRPTPSSTVVTGVPPAAVHRSVGAPVRPLGLGAPLPDPRLGASGPATPTWDGARRATSVRGGLGAPLAPPQQQEGPSWPAPHVRPPGSASLPPVAHGRPTDGRRALRRRPAASATGTTPDRRTGAEDEHVREGDDTGTVGRSAVVEGEDAEPADRAAAAAEVHDTTASTDDASDAEESDDAHDDDAGDDSDDSDGDPDGGGGDGGSGSGSEPSVAVVAVGDDPRADAGGGDERPSGPSAVRTGDRAGRLASGGGRPPRPVSPGELSRAALPVARALPSAPPPARTPTRSPVGTALLPAAVGAATARTTLPAWSITSGRSTSASGSDPPGAPAALHRAPVVRAARRTGPAGAARTPVTWPSAAGPVPPGRVAQRMPTPLRLRVPAAAAAVDVPRPRAVPAHVVTLARRSRVPALGLSDGRLDRARPLRAPRPPGPADVSRRLQPVSAVLRPAGRPAPGGHVLRSGSPAASGHAPLLRSAHAPGSPHRAVSHRAVSHRTSVPLAAVAARTLPAPTAQGPAPAGRLVPLPLAPAPVPPAADAAHDVSPGPDGTPVFDVDDAGDLSDRSTGSTTSTETSMSRPRTPGDVAVQQGLADRAPDGSVVFRTPGPDAVGSPGVAPAPAAPPELDLDELARRLYGPLRAQLQAELRLDRERAGLVTDLRS